ncbi:hypothetical protein ES5_08431 [Dietzia cinnamea P4]|nr:hypothetical protein ES5_08431 [Dietzia cinnamea P4]
MWLAVTRALVRTPAAVPISTITRASSRASAGSGRNAPEPYLTSSTSAPVPSAIFLLMIDAASMGIDGTVPVTSRRAYRARSAGARSDPAAQITAPVRPRTSRIAATSRSARHPGIDSSLSRVPPVWPSPRPDSCGTATSQVASSGVSTRVIASPTPPVECLSTVGTTAPPRGTVDRSSRVPERTMAEVHREISRSVMPRK